MMKSFDEILERVKKIQVLLQEHVIHLERNSTYDIALLELKSELDELITDISGHDH